MILSSYVNAPFLRRQESLDECELYCVYDGSGGVESDDEPYPDDPQPLSTQPTTTITRTIKPKKYAFTSIVAHAASADRKQMSSESSGGDLLALEDTLSRLCPAISNKTPAYSAATALSVASKLTFRASSARSTVLLKSSSSIEGAEDRPKPRVNIMGWLKSVLDSISGPQEKQRQELTDDEHPAEYTVPVPPLVTSIISLPSAVKPVTALSLGTKQQTTFQLEMGKLDPTLRSYRPHASPLDQIVSTNKTHTSPHLSRSVITKPSWKLGRKSPEERVDKRSLHKYQYADESTQAVIALASSTRTSHLSGTSPSLPRTIARPSSTPNPVQQSRKLTEADTLPPLRSADSQDASSPQNSRRENQRLSQLLKDQMNDDLVESIPIYRYGADGSSDRCLDTYNESIPISQYGADSSRDRCLDTYNADVEEIIMGMSARFTPSSSPRDIPVHDGSHHVPNDNSGKFVSSCPTNVREALEDGETVYYSPSVNTIYTTSSNRSSNFSSKRKPLLSTNSLSMNQYYRKRDKDRSTDSLLTEDISSAVKKFPVCSGERSQSASHYRSLREPPSRPSRSPSPSSPTNRGGTINTDLIQSDPDVLSQFNVNIRRNSKGVYLESDSSPPYMNGQSSLPNSGLDGQQHSTRAKGERTKRRSKKKMPQSISSKDSFVSSASSVLPRYMQDTHNFKPETIEGVHHSYTLVTYFTNESS
jgi:hypothetical protein